MITYKITRSTGDNSIARIAANQQQVASFINGFGLTECQYTELSRNKELKEFSCATKKCSSRCHNMACRNNF